MTDSRLKNSKKIPWYCPRIAVPTRRPLVRASELVFIFAGFPFLFPVGIYSDLQPWAAIIASLLVLSVFMKGLLTGKLGASKNLWAIMLYCSFPLLYFTFISAYYGDFDPRPAYSWLSLALFVFVGMHIDRDFIRKSLPWILAIWCVVALVQRLWNHLFLSWLVLRMHSSQDRGVTSLAVEPSVYGNHVLLLAALYFIVLPKQAKSTARDQFVAGLALFQLFFLSQSFATVAFGFILVLGLLKCLFSNRLLRAFFIVFMAISLFSGVSIDFGGRMGALWRLVRKEPAALVQRDESGKERVANFMYPIKIFVGELPNSFGFYPTDEILQDLRTKYQDKLTFGPHFVSSRISSAWGTVLFQLGIFGVIWASTLVAFSLMQRSLTACLYALGFVVLLWSSVPWATPLVGILFGFLFRGSFLRFDKSEVECA